MTLIKADEWEWISRHSSLPKKIGVSSFPSDSSVPNFPAVGQDHQWAGEEKDKAGASLGNTSAISMTHLRVPSIQVFLLRCPPVGPGSSRAKQVFPMGTALALHG